MPQPLGQKLYLLRIQKGMTQRGISLRTGIPQGNLSNIEKGKQDPTVSTLVRICRAIGVSPGELFREEPPPRRFVLTRGFLETIARAVVGSPEKLGEEERKVVERLRDIIPGLRPKPLSSKKVYESWYELKQRFSREEIRTLTERIRDAEQRLKVLRPR